MKNFEGERFLHQKNPKLHTSESIEKTKKRVDLESEKPEEKISVHLERIKNILEPKPLKEGSVFDRKERNINLLKKGLYNSVIIKAEDVPESYFDNQRRLAREQGHGDIRISDEMRDQLTEIIIADQKSTLDNWIDYLTSTDSESYPMWAKYWSYDGVLKLSSYDKERKAFVKRNKGTVAPFPDLNREALAYTIDAIIKKVNRENIPLEAENPQFKKILQGANFGKLYAWAIEKVTPAEESELLEIKGEWIKYNQGADYLPLVKSLQGQGTGWCTAGENTAKIHLKDGDFYVYYSHDQEGKPTVPRIAIRMQGDKRIAEVRGVASEQNLDSQILKTNILEEKLKEFGAEGKKYQKRTADMKKLTEIERKQQENQNLTREDIRFLYEIDSKIQGFGYKKDPRIKEIQEQRNIRKDLSFALSCSEAEISFTQKEALRGGIKYHHGDLDLANLTSAEGVELPELIGGGLYLRSLTSAEGLKLPKTIGGNLNLRSLTSAEGLKLPKTIGGNLNLSSLTSAKGLIFSESIEGDVDLSSLTSAEGLKLPKTIGGNLYLPNLTSIENLELSEFLMGNIHFYNITAAEKLNLRRKYPNLNII